MTVPLTAAIERNRDLTLLLITAPLGHDDAFDRSVSDFFTVILAAIKRLLLEGMEGGTIHAFNADIISYMILGSVKQILLQWLVYGDIGDITTPLDDIIEYTLSGSPRGRIPMRNQRGLQPQPASGTNRTHTIHHQERHHECAGQVF